MGGLGNQMFQIAAAYSLALDNNDIAEFDFSKCYTPLQGYPSARYKNNLFKNIIDNPDLVIENVFEETSYFYSEIPYTKNLMLKGYFQNEKYFGKHQNNIFDLFHFSQEDIKKLNELFDFDNNKYVSVQIRRGDYLKFPDIHPPCSIEYYNQAINFFEKDYKFIFVSDDMNWVRNNFKDKNYYYLDTDNEILSLTLLTLCNSSIISNSTFGWWGAYLNLNKNKKIIAPSIWFGEAGPEEEIVPEDWIKINQ